MPTHPSGPPPVTAEDYSLRRIAVPAFGPSTIWSVGAGAAMPILALSARDLGASVGLAAIFVGLSTVAELLFAVPAGVLVDRLGERRALILAGTADAAAASLAFLAPNLAVLALALSLTGPSGGVFLLARQSYLSAAAPPLHRARALSTLGGASRVGFLVGPLIAAPLIHRWGAHAGYLVPAVTGLLAVAVTVFSMDITAAHDAQVAREAPRVRQVVRDHRRVLATVGVGVLAIGLARSSRVVALPLWSEHIGLSAAQTSMVFAAAFALEVLLFYPAGSLMDRRGRAWVAVPVSILLGLGLLCLPLTHSLTAVSAIALLMGLGNGLGSGIVMTLGADAAPDRGRAQFLGVWRLLSLVGHNGASVVVGGLAAVLGIGAASAGVGLLTLLGGAWLARWLPEYDPRRPRTGHPPPTSTS